MTEGPVTGTTVTSGVLVGDVALVLLDTEVSDNNVPDTDVADIDV